MGRVMFFLLRMAFWLGVVCVLLPSGAKSTSPEANIDATQAVTLASAAVSDVRGFCERQPDACVVGGKVAVAIGHKAEAGARTIYEFITTKLAEKSAPAEKTAAKDGHRSAGARPRHADRRPTCSRPGMRRFRCRRAARRAPAGRPFKHPHLSAFCRGPRRPPRSFLADRRAPGLYIGGMTHDRRNRREFHAARSVGRPLSLCHRARPHAAAAAGRRP